MDTMLRPSGENDGYSTQSSMGSCRTWLPSGSTSQPDRRPLEPRSELKTIVEPSGDQSGPQSFAGSFVRFRRSEPPARATAISSATLMPRGESRYTTHAPSEDHAP